MFYFITFEQLRDRTGQSIYTPTIAPSARVDGGPGGVPQINPVMVPLLSLFPPPNLSGNYFTFPATLQDDESYGQARVDYILSANDAVFGRYTGDGAQRLEPMAFPEFARVGYSRMQFVTLSETHTFSPASVGTFRLSFSKPTINVDSTSTATGPQYSLVPGQPTGNITIGGITVSNSNTTFGTDANAPNRTTRNVFSWSGDLYYTKGRHSLKYGILANHYHPESNAAGTNLRGTATFANVQSFLLGQTTTYTAPTLGSTTRRDYNFSTWGFYAQDDLRVMPRFTLNLGLRYEFSTDFTETNGRGSSLRSIRADAAFTPGLMFQNPSLKNFSPRFGFAWDVTGDGKSSVRGGFGLLYDVADLGGSLSHVSNAQLPFSSQSTIATPSVLTSLPLSFPANAIGKAVRTMDYHLQQPHMLQYNFTLERQLPSNIALSLAYAGSRGLNLLSS